MNDFGIVVAYLWFLIFAVVLGAGRLAGRAYSRVYTETGEPLDWEEFAPHLRDGVVSLHAGIRRPDDAQNKMVEVEIEEGEALHV